MLKIASGARLITGTGTPEGAVSGSVGDVFQRTDGGAGTTFYVKESGSATTTGWVALPDDKAKASSTDTTPGYLDASPTGGKIAVEGASLETHASGGNEQVNIYPIPGIVDDFSFLRPFWVGTQALTSADWAVDTVNGWVQCNAANNATDWIRAGIDGDFDYYFRWTINGATTVGFQVDGNSNTITLKWSANVITRTMTGQSNQTVAFTPAAGNVMLRIKRAGTAYRFYYREGTADRWTEFTAANYSINLGIDTVLRLSSTGSINARIREMYLWDSRMPQVMNGVRAKMIPLTDGATITPNATNGMINTVTLGGNRTIAAPTQWSVPDGTMFVLRLRQDASPPRTVTWDTIYRFPSGTAPTLSTGANKTDYFGFAYNATDTKYDCIAQEFNL